MSNKRFEIGESDSQSSVVNSEQTGFFNNVYARSINIQDNIEIGPFYSFMGRSNGFVAGQNYAPPFGNASANEINKFPFSITSGNVTVVGDLTEPSFPDSGADFGLNPPAPNVGQKGYAGKDSSDNLYVDAPSQPNVPGEGASAPITFQLVKFPGAIGTPGVGTTAELVTAIPAPTFPAPVANVRGFTFSGGATTSEKLFRVGQSPGGYPGVPNPGPTFIQGIHSFDFASGNLSQAVGTMASEPRYGNALYKFQSSSHGYYTGGHYPGAPPSSSSSIPGIIYKYPFAISSGETSTPHGGITPATLRTGFGTFGSDGDHGYIIGGRTFPPFSGQTTILKFPFAGPPATVTDVGEIIFGNYVAGGHALPSHPYDQSALYLTSFWRQIPPGPNAVNQLYKIPFTFGSGGTMTEVGEYSPPNASPTAAAFSGGMGGAV